MVELLVSVVKDDYLVEKHVCTAVKVCEHNWRSVVMLYATGEMLGKDGITDGDPGPKLDMEH